MEDLTLIAFLMVFSISFLSVFVTDLMAKKYPDLYGHELIYPKSKGVIYWATLVFWVYAFTVIELIILLFITNKIF